MRCFIGVFPCTDSAERLSEAVLLPQLARPVPAQNYHVTLRFLGEIVAEDVPAVLAAVAELDGGRVEALVTGFVGFPSPVRARLIAAELAAPPELTAWAEQLAERRGTGDQRLFRPHITVARLRRPARIDAWAPSEPLHLRFEPPALYRSCPVPGGVRYEPVTAEER
jgi:RNA 2',3'-cyclic 3'-phosphodiesterase